MWEVLLAATELKSVHMSQAWQLEKFNHGIDNMTAWLSEIEATLSSPDFGIDLASVENLTKEHALLERDIKTHKDIIDINCNTFHGNMLLNLVSVQVILRLIEGKCPPAFNSGRIIM